jgi:hypothetical protein
VKSSAIDEREARNGNKLSTKPDWIILSFFLYRTLKATIYTFTAWLSKSNCLARLAT